MTDPIQTDDPQQQGQQWYIDDILGWDDIFAAIPKAALEKEDIPYGELLEKKYQFSPVPEVEVPTVNIPDTKIQTPPSEPVPPIAPPVPVTREIPMVTPPLEKPVVQIVPQVSPLPPKTPIIEKKPVPSPIHINKEIPKVVPSPTVAIPRNEVKKQVDIPVSRPPAVSPVEEKVQVKEPIAPIVPEKKPAEIQKEVPLKEVPVEDVLDTKFQTDVQKKFGELFSTTKKIYQLKDKLWITEETFDILWADNDKIFISYRFLLDETDEPILFITKIEQDKETEEETINELRFTFNEETSSLEVVINDTLLFDEVEDFTEDQKKKLQVVDKINKFTFLASEELRKIEKEIKEKEEAEQERKKLQEIFRNF